MASKGRQLKELINSPKILVTPGVYDGYSARLTEQLGFKSGSITGAGTSESRLGWADRGVMGLDENVANARRLADCSDLLLRADADTGYGNAMSVYFATRAFEKAGVAAVMFEDQVWPKRCGHMAGKSVIPAEEMVQKVKAACDARHRSRFRHHLAHRCRRHRTAWTRRSAGSICTPRPAPTACTPMRCCRRRTSRRSRRTCPSRSSSTWGWACARARPRR